jgi:hypothetical protein
MAKGAAMPLNQTQMNALVWDWLDLPGNERDYYARAIAARAAWWRLSEKQQAQIQRGRYLRFRKAALTAPAGSVDDEDGDWPAT